LRSVISSRNRRPSGVMVGLRREGHSLRSGQYRMQKKAQEQKSATLAPSPAQRVSSTRDWAWRGLCGAPHNRANWLHVGGDGGLKTASVLLSVCASATRHRLNPWAYLRNSTARQAGLPIRMVFGREPHDE
jgi:hypothetical protein